MSTPEQRAEWRRLEQAATPGEWTHKLDPAWNNKDRIIENPEGFVIIRDENCHAHFKFGRDEANYDFIAAARTAVPALLDDVECLLAENAQLRAQLREALLEIAQCGRKKENR